MLYRIRYKEANAGGEMETTVEANGPSEAVVKFQLVSASTTRQMGERATVTSVFADEAG